MVDKELLREIVERNKFVIFIKMFWRWFTNEETIRSS